MTGASGVVIQTHQYDAWGNTEVGADQPGYAFTGREWDPEVALYFYRARYYDPKVGRFVSEDPIGPEGGMHLFAYTGGSPVIHSDPWGLRRYVAWEEEITAVLRTRQFWGESKECVSLVKHMTKAPHSFEWRKGPSVLAGGSVARGTGIATFDAQGLYPQTGRDKNSAVFLKKSPDGIIVIDQWPPYHVAQPRLILVGGGAPEDGANAYSVITTCSE
jgi:RHS repeat-associated protein